MADSKIFLLGGDSLRKANKNPNPPAEQSLPATSRRRAVALSGPEESARVTLKGAADKGGSHSNNRIFLRASPQSATFWQFASPNGESLHIVIDAAVGLCS